MSSSRLGEKLPAPFDLRRPTCAWYAGGKSRHSISTVVFVDGISTPKCLVMVGEYTRSAGEGTVAGQTIGFEVHSRNSGGPVERRVPETGKESRHELESSARNGGRPCHRPHVLRSHAARSNKVCLYTTVPP